LQNKYIFKKVGIQVHNHVLHFGWQTLLPCTH